MKAARRQVKLPYGLRLLGSPTLRVRAAVARLRRPFSAEEVVRVAVTMSVASLCGYGQSTGQAVLVTLKRFWDEVVG